jgi:hypothetical protein
MKILPEDEWLNLPMNNWKHKLTATPRMESKKQTYACPKYAFNFFAQCLKLGCIHEEAGILSKRRLEEMFEMAHREENPVRIFNTRLMGHGENGVPNGSYKTPQCFSPDDIFEAAKKNWPREFTDKAVTTLKSQKAEVRNRKRRAADAESGREHHLVRLIK